MAKKLGCRVQSATEQGFRWGGGGLTAGTSGVDAVGGQARAVGEGEMRPPTSRTFFASAAFRPQYLFPMNIGAATAQQSQPRPSLRLWRHRGLGRPD